MHKVASSITKSEPNKSNGTTTTGANRLHPSISLEGASTATTSSLQGFNSPPQADDESDDDEDSKPDIRVGGTKRNGRRKIKIEYIEDRARRHITFSKRKAGIMKKAYELSTLTGTQVLLLVVSETGLVYTFTTPKLQPLVTKPEGKGLIQACLNIPDKPSSPPPLGTCISDSPQHSADRII